MAAELLAQLALGALQRLPPLMDNYPGAAAMLTAVDMQLHKGKEPLLPIV